jgi:hypothetical protein
MTAQFRGPAQLNRAHHTPFDASEMTVMNSTIGLAVAAKDVRHLQSSRHSQPQAGGTTSRLKRSSGLFVFAIVVVATWV